MYPIKKTTASIIAVVLIFFFNSINFLLTIAATRCGGGASLTVQISNPEWQTPIGWGGTPNPQYGPGFEVEITVNTLNSNNQAVFFSTKVVQFVRTSNVGTTSDFIINDVSIPPSGAYVIQYTLRSHDCTWPQAASNCYTPNLGFASKKYFKDQYTFATGGNPGSYSFFCTFSNRYTDICC